MNGAQDIARKAALLASLSIAANCMLAGSHPADKAQREAITLDLIGAVAYLSAQVSASLDALADEEARGAMPLALQ